VSGAGSNGPYWGSVALALVVLVALCVQARRRPGQWTTWVAWALGAVLVGEQISWQANFFIDGNWTITHSLPLDLCDVMALVAAFACWWRTPVLVEMTWFWGLAGTLQAVATPDVGATFPHLEFVNYVVEHLIIVIVAVYLVVGLRLVPRRGSVGRMFAILLVYAAIVGAVDAGTGANYLFLRHPPSTYSLLDDLGPWPWYIGSCAGLAVVLFAVLDLPFRGRVANRTPLDTQIRPAN
jgi:hypothetical integral membrane protein (TIGR02206 family)